MALPSVVACARSISRRAFDPAVSAAKVLYGADDWNLTSLLARFPAPVALAGALVVVASLLVCNCIANWCLICLFSS